MASSPPSPDAAAADAAAADAAAADAAAADAAAHDPATSDPEASDPEASDAAAAPVPGVGTAEHEERGKEPPEEAGPLMLLWREIPPTLRLAGPVVAAQLGQMSMGFVDTVMVGRLGPEALAGVALGNTVFFTLLVLCTGTVQAVGPMVSQAFGGEQPDAIGRNTRQGLWLGVALTVPVLAFLWNVEGVLRLLGQPESAVEGASGYLRAIMWAFLPACWFTALRSFVEGVGRPLPVTIITLVGLCINAAANYVLMFGKLGLPALGLTGTGWASTVVFWSMFAMLAALVLWASPFRQYRVFRRLGVPDLDTLRELVDVGWPMGISRGIEAGLFMTTALLVGTLGSTALAAHQVAIQCAAFTFMVPLGVGIAGLVRVGHAAGRGDPGGVRRAGYAAMSVATAFMMVSAVAFWTFPEFIVGLYVDTAEPVNAGVVALAVQLLGIAAVFQVFDGAQIAAAEALRGLKDTRGPMYIGLISYWGVGLGSGTLLGLHLGYGAQGLWWGLVLGLVAASIWLTYRFHRQTREVV